MRSGTPRYPVDRYMVESSKKTEMVNIIDDEIWNPEPALRPEDEIILRKLHDMLLSTADDLKLLSGELSKFHEPGVQVKTQPTPLDEEFNQRVHIEEVVNAKFHGYKIVDKPPATSEIATANGAIGLKLVLNNVPKPKINSGVQVNSVHVVKRPVKSKNLGITRTKVIEIDGKNEDDGKKKLNNGKVINTMPAVAYNEFSYKYVERKVSAAPKKSLHVQQMPSINIRSELKEQKVLQLDIVPNTKDKQENLSYNSNVAVVSMEHESAIIPQNEAKSYPTVNYQRTSQPALSKMQPVRKMTKISTCESSGSTNNVSSDAQHNMNTQKKIQSVIKSSPKCSARLDRSKNKKISFKKESDKTRLNLDEWKTKLNSVYGLPSTSKTKVLSESIVKKVQPKKSSLPPRNKSIPKLNNADYIPYSQLTVGGVSASDIEREIIDIPNKKDLPLSPILDRILSSRENSFQDSPRNCKKTDQHKILTTSDENLLQEVIDIERTVKKTISKNFKKKENKTKDKVQTVSSESTDGNENDSYADDFEDEKSEQAANADENIQSDSNQSEQNVSKEASVDSNEDFDTDTENNEMDHDLNTTQTDVHNATYTKRSNLSLKKSVDIFEFVHSVDTHDTATQSIATNKISLKETQTSPPPNERLNIQPIHNDLWPSIDPRGAMDKMFKLEKDFIKKLIMEEYGDLIEKNITKPSTSRGTTDSDSRNVVATQKNTQTSPAHVKSVMTSPTRTKTRTTSPFLSLKVDHQTSPMIVVTNDEDLDVEVDQDELGISINLSSPRFSLRLPQTSQEISSNLEDSSPCKSTTNNQQNVKSRMFRKSTVSSSSSVDAYSSSDISSLGEVKLKLRRRLRKSKFSSISESSSSSKYSSDGPSAGIVPLRSEGEVSFGQQTQQLSKKKLNRASKSEGETSFGAFSSSK